MLVHSLFVPVAALLGSLFSKAEEQELPFIDLSPTLSQEYLELILEIKLSTGNVCCCGTNVLQMKG